MQIITFVHLYERSTDISTVFALHSAAWHFASRPFECRPEIRKPHAVRTTTCRSAQFRPEDGRRHTSGFVSPKITVAAWIGTSAPELRIRRLRPIRSKSHSGACAAVHSRPVSEEAYGRRPFGIGTMATADRKIQTGLRDNRPSVRKRKDREHHPAAQINKLLINNE